jgi:hypothetical protein
MKDYSTYETKLPYPQKPTKPRLDHATVTSTSAKEHAEHLAEFERLLTQYRADKEAYDKDCEACLAAFKHDLFADLGLKDHPKAEKLYQIAWDRGHSSGLENVYCEASELAALIVD